MLPWNKWLLKKTDRLLTPWLCKASELLAQDASRRTEVSGEYSSELPVPADALKRILIIRPGGLGDAVLTFPMIRALRDHFGEAQIHVLAETRNAAIYAINPHVRRVYLYDRRLPIEMARLFRNHYDLIVDTEQFHHLSTGLAFALRPDYLCGFASPLRSRLATHSALYRKDRYEALSFLDLADALTGKMIPFDPDQAFLEIPAALEAWADRIFRVLDGRPFVTIVLTATAQERLWPSERFINVLDWLHESGYAPVILGGQDAIGISESLTTAFGRSSVLNLTGHTTLPQSAALIQKARAHLSSDTGALHVAYGVGTPTVSLFGPGLHKKWAPIGTRHVMIRADVPCSPCADQGQIPPCPHGVLCMKAIPVDWVKAGLQEVLEI